MLKKGNASVGLKGERRKKRGNAASSGYNGKMNWGKHWKQWLQRKKNCKKWFLDLPRPIWPAAKNNLNLKFFFYFKSIRLCFVNHTCLLKQD